MVNTSIADTETFKKFLTEENLKKFDDNIKKQAIKAEKQMLKSMKSRNIPKNQTIYSKHKQNE